MRPLAAPNARKLPGGPPAPVGIWRAVTTSPASPRDTTKRAPPRCAAGGGGASREGVGARLLATLSGDEAVRRMARVARARLTTRLDELVAERAGPFQERLEALAGLGDPAELAVAVDQLEQLAQQIREER